MKQHYPTWNPGSDNPLFWAIHATKTASRVEALKNAWNAKTKRHLTATPLRDALRDALWEGARLLNDQAKQEFEDAKKDGVLLFAWAGSTVMKGGAA